jgi:hypothetical protein
MYYKTKKNNVSSVYQNEDKYSRFDYGKTKVDFTASIRGEGETIKDCR